MRFEPVTPPLLSPVRRRHSLTADMVATIIFKAAWRALVRAFLIQLLAGIAIRMLSVVVAEMTPSLPPGVDRQSPAAALESSMAAASHRFLLEHRFGVLFAALFIILCVGQLTRFLRRPKHRAMAALAIWISRRMARGWFKIIVRNAFIAWVGAILFVVAQRLSLSQLLWRALSGLVQPYFAQMMTAAPGGGWVARWSSWYGQNEVKLVFWLFYLGAIADDLGLPNYKTVFQWGKRRFVACARSALKIAPRD